MPRWPCRTVGGLARAWIRQRPRPERGAQSPRESERGWGPASMKNADGVPVEIRRQAVCPPASRLHVQCAWAHQALGALRAALGPQAQNVNLNPIWPTRCSG